MLVSHMASHQHGDTVRHSTHRVQEWLPSVARTSYHTAQSPNAAGHMYAPQLPVKQPPLHDEHAAKDVAPGSEYGADDPHTAHTPRPPALYVPGWHSTAVELVDPAGHAYPAPHGPEHVAKGRPVAPPYVPAGHELHDPAPDSE